MNQRSECLRTAEQLVNGDRNTQYDEPAADFKRTAGMWEAYLGIPIELHDVAAMMAMLKLARIRHAPHKADSWIDLAGYAACGFDVRPEEQGVWLVPSHPNVSHLRPGHDLLVNMDPA